MFITRKHLSRRTVLQGVGVSLALPLLDSMVPASTPAAKTAAAAKTRLVAIEMVHGAAGSTELGRIKHYWSPAQEGREFEFTQTLQSLEPLRDYITVISDTEHRNAMSLTESEDGMMADHARSSAVFLTGAHPRRTAGLDIEAGPSIDQIYAQRVGHETVLPSIQLCIEDIGSLSGACGHDYSCAYTNTISWGSATRPLSMERAPRAVFNQLFRVMQQPRSVGSAGGGGSILDGLTDQLTRVSKRVGPHDRARMGEYVEAVRDTERRIQEIEGTHSGDTGQPFSGAPSSVPDSFDEHVRLMFDLQVLAFMADITRICAFKMGVDRSGRVYAQSGITTPFHALSHHRQIPERIEEFARLNQYHVTQVGYFLDRLRNTPDGNGNLLDHSVVLYGSPMGDSHVHGHTNLPLFLAGKASGKLTGNLHVRCAQATPMANVLLTLLHKLGVDIGHIGDSSGTVPI